MTEASDHVSMDERLRRLASVWRALGSQADLERAADLEALIQVSSSGGRVSLSSILRLDRWVEQHWRPEMDVAVLVAVTAARVPESQWESLSQWVDLPVEDRGGVAPDVVGISPMSAEDRTRTECSLAGVGLDGTLLGDGSPARLAEVIRSICDAMASYAGPLH